MLSCTGCCRSRAAGRGWPRRPVQTLTCLILNKSTLTNKRLRFVSFPTQTNLNIWTNLKVRFQQRLLRIWPHLKTSKEAWNKQFCLSHLSCYLSFLQTLYSAHWHWSDIWQVHWWLQQMDQCEQKGSAAGPRQLPSQENIRDQGADWFRSSFNFADDRDRFILMIRAHRTFAVRQKL